MTETYAHEPAAPLLSHPFPPEPFPAEPRAINRALGLAPVAGDQDPAEGNEGGSLLASWRQRAEQAEAQAQKLAQRHERMVCAYESRQQAALQTLTYRLGDTLIRGFRSPLAAMRLPAALLALRREARRRRSLRKNQTQAINDRLALEKQAKVQAAALQAQERARLSGMALALTEEARRLQDSDPQGSARAAQAAYDADPRPWRAKWLAFRLYDIGHLRQPAALLAALPPRTAFSTSETTRSNQIQALAGLLEAGIALPEQAEATPYAPLPDSLLYCAASARPWHTSGYTMRTQALLRALKAQGVALTAVTRAGYPWDRPDSQGTPAQTHSHHDGIDWHHLRQPGQNLPLDLYVSRAGSALVRLAKRARVSAIHAASNHVNALPALVAARRLGLPFHYELRGLWELSRAANVPGFAQSERYDLGLALEAQVARAATRVYAISQALADHACREWGLDPARITILPNGIEAERLGALETQRHPAFTLGYAGALVAYEGLDLLLDALALLRDQGRSIALEVIGDGPLRGALEAQARALGLAGQARFLGALEPEAAQARLAACHATCLPRPAHPVAQLIPPLKLVEAMALGLALVVPDLPAFRAEAVEGQTALFFDPGDRSALAAAIARLHDDPALTDRLGQAARAQTLATRDWSVHAATLAAHLPRLDPPRKPGEGLVADLPALIAQVTAQGSAPALAALAQLPANDEAERATQTLQLGQCLGSAGSLGAEADLAEAALTFDRGIDTLARAHAAFERAGQFDRCADMRAEIETHPGLHEPGDGASARARADKLRRGLAGQVDMVRLIGPRRARVLTPEPGRICYVLHNSLPWSSGGYATRSHGLATGLRAAGCDVRALSRPGFPFDVLPTLTREDVPEEDWIDGLAYGRLPEPTRAGMRYARYVPAAAAVLEDRFRALRPALVMAASNHIVGLPALIAARRLGLPFAYEVRGFWEVTRVSRDEAYRETASYKLQERLEAAIASAADQVFTLTEPMREELIARQVPGQAIALLPNSCDPDRFCPRPRDLARAAALGLPPGVPVIGYVGTFVDYEGLDDLARACTLLKQQGHVFRLLLVGNENTSGQERGPITQAITEIAQEGGYADWLILPGRVPHDEVESWYSLIDICPFPRKPWPVCEMVSPMKPLEALAMEKAVVVSDVRALAEMIDHEGTGLVFAKGEADSLALALARLLDDEGLRRALGRQGRAWVCATRTWAKAGERARALLHPWLALAEAAADPLEHAA